MRPNVDYRFRIRTRNRVGTSEPSVATTDTCVLQATHPESNPKELYVYGTEVNNLVIQWSVSVNSCETYSIDGILLSPYADVVKRLEPFKLCIDGA